MTITIEDHYDDGLTKREISVAEKKTADLTGDTLNFLYHGEEIGELLAAGSAPEFTYSLEGYPDRDPQTKEIAMTIDQKIRAAKRKYPQIPAGCFLKYRFRTFLNEQMGSDSYDWTYVHLDYCGLATDERLIEISDAAKFIAPGGRLRVTLLASDKPRYGLEQPFDTYEATLKMAHDMIEPFGYPNIHAVIYKGTGAKMLTFWADRNK